MKNPSIANIKKLFAASGNVCAFPGCNNPIVEETGSITGKICHIKARNKNGPRFDSQQKDEERNGYDNLILLCGKHHDIIDKESEIYDVDSLLEMKKIHESYMTRGEMPEDELFAKYLINNLKKK